MRLKKIVLIHLTSANIFKIVTYLNAKLLNCGCTNQGLMYIVVGSRWYTDKSFPIAKPLRVASNHVYSIFKKQIMIKMNSH